MSIKFKDLSVKELLQLNANTIQELKQRGVVRTNNKPLGDYAEWLVAQILDLELAQNSKAGWDAMDVKGVRYQIKARSVVDPHKSVQLSAIRKLNEHDFDYLIIIFFDDLYEVVSCTSLPWDAVDNLAYFQKHTNAHILHVKPSEIVERPDANDLTHLFSTN
jgi:hypothetical protein